MIVDDNENSKRRSQGVFITTEQIITIIATP